MTNNDPTNLPTIAVVGAASVDITIREAPDWMGLTARDAYTADSLHSLEAPVEMGLGGNGGAAAYVLGKLGLPVELYASIGADAPGQLVLSWLKQADVSYMETKPVDSTMVAITAVDGQGQRLGCVQHLGAQVDWSVPASHTQASWLLVMVHAQVTVDELQALRQTIQQFRQSGCTTVLDSGIGWIVDRVEPQQMHALWSHTNVVTGTLDELSHWTARDDPKSIARAVLDHGAQQVIIKMGADGAAYQSGVEAFTHQKAVLVRHANLSIGAGDAFAGALVAALAIGEPLSVAVSNAQRLAAQVVEAGRGVLGWCDPSDLASEKYAGSPIDCVDGCQPEDRS
jgi:dehydrogluconokinase